MSNLIPIEYQNQRVLTTIELADAYGAEPVKIQQNFSNNKDRYTEGKHFFLLQGNELQEFLRLEIFEVQNQSKIRSLYLWTEKGAWLHAKSLNTGKAWKAYETLVDDYYSIKQLQPKDSYMITDPIERAKAWIIEAEQTKTLTLQLEAQHPKVIFADSVSTSHTSILIGELAKIIKGNGVDIGEKRFFAWLRDNKYLISRKGTDYNAPTQRSMDLGIFKVKETVVTHSDGHITINKTTKCTGKGQIYFVNKFKEEPKCSEQSSNAQPVH